MADAATETLIDFDRFSAATLPRALFDHLVVPGFLPPSAAQAAPARFAAPDLPGVLPPEPLPAAFAEKFDLRLSPAQLMVTLRARTRRIDGRIHTDSAATAGTMSAAGCACCADQATSTT
jgi:hypothetical protein